MERGLADPEAYLIEPVRATLALGCHSISIVGDN